MSLLLDMAREAVLAKVQQRVSRLSRHYVERWIAGEFSLVDRVARRHENDIKAWQDVVLQTMDALTVEELLAVCQEARPDFEDLWRSEGAHARLSDEWGTAREYVQGL